MQRNERKRLHLFPFRFPRKRSIFILSLAFTLLICVASAFLLIGSPLTLFQPLSLTQSQIGSNTAPASGTFHGCPAQGNGGDSQLNLLKNRVDTANWLSMAWSQLASLPYPSTVLHQDMATWSASDAAQVAGYNGHPVSVTGYLVGVHTSHTEPTNCNSAQDVDYHLGLGSSLTSTEANTIVTEATPRLRAKHAGWTLSRFQLVASRHLPVTISGWTLLDPENDGPRVGPWEIHPIMQMMVQVNGSWVSLDSAPL